MRFRNENVALPYQPVTETVGYIRSSNPFYFNTYINPVNNDVEVEIKLQMKNLAQFDVHDGPLYRANWSVRGYLMMNSFENSSYAFKWHYGGGYQFFGTRTTDDIVLKQGLTQCYINGNPVGTSYTITNSYNNLITMFEPQAGYSLNMKLYYIKMWKAGTLVRHYVVKNENNTLRLYENVSQSYPNVYGQLYDSFD